MTNEETKAEYGQKKKESLEYLKNAGAYMFGAVVNGQIVVGFGLNGSMKPDVRVVLDMLQNTALQAFKAAEITLEQFTKQVEARRDRN
jgi:hypothetical protein